jgi:4-oxalocrotonate tautomerase
VPIVQISLLAGRDAATKRAVIAAVTSAVTRSLGVREEQVRVLLYEVPSDGWGVAGRTKDDG